MEPTESMLLAARNAFLVLFGLSVYQFVTDGGFLAGALWTLGAVVFYISKYYYRRQETPDDGSTGEASA